MVVLSALSYLDLIIVIRPYRTYIFLLYVLDTKSVISVGCILDLALVPLKMFRWRLARI